MKMISLLVLILIFPFNGIAQDIDPYELSLSELGEVRYIIISSGFFPIEVSSSPGYAEVFGEDNIRDGTARSLSDFLDGYVPNMQVSRQFAFGVVPGVRGLQVDSGTKTMTLYNGIQLSPKVGYGFGHFYDTPLLGDLQRIEVIHGPGAIRYGAGAVNGVINSISKTGISHPGLEIGASYGASEKLFIAEIGYGKKYGSKDDQHIYIYFGAYNADGFEPDNSYGADLSAASESARSALGYEGVNYRSSLYWQHGDLNLKAVTMYTKASKNSDRARVGPIWHSRNLALKPSYIIALGKDKSLEFDGSLVFWENGHSTTDPNKDITQKSTEDHYDAKATYKSRTEGYDLAVGTNISYKKMINKDHFPGMEDFIVSMDDIRWVYSLFADYTMHLSPIFDVALGLRYDYHDYEDYGYNNSGGPITYFVNEMDPHWSPRIALSYQAREDLRINLSYQHGFRTPTTSEYFFVNRLNEMAAYNNFPLVLGLKPETMENVELNLHYTASDAVTITLSLFDNYYKNLITWARATEGNSIWTTEQIEDISAAGVTLYSEGEGWVGRFFNINVPFHNIGGELSIKWEPTDMGHVRASYSYTVTDRDIDASFSQYYPRHMAKVDAIWYLSDKKAALSANYIYGSDVDERDIAPTRPMHEVYRDQRHRLDLAVKYAFTPQLSLKLTMANLFEGDPAPFYDPPEQGSLGHGDRRFYLEVNACF